jgi:hypothetical protein
MSEFTDADIRVLREAHMGDYRTWAMRNSQPRCEMASKSGVPRAVVP